MNGAPKRTLRVLPYRFLPDVHSAAHHVAKTFQKVSPDVAVEIGHPPQCDLSRDPYELDWLAAALEAGQCDVAEIDTVLIGDLISRGSIRPIPNELLGDRSLYRTASWGTVHCGGVPYGVPSWMCSLFCFSRSKDARDADSTDQLRDAVVGANGIITADIGPQSPPWRLIEFYMLSLLSNTGSRGSGSVSWDDLLLSGEVSGEHLDSLMEFLALGDADGCGTGALEDEGRAASRFWGDSSVVASVGYSESLGMYSDLASSAFKNGSLFVSAVPMCSDRRRIVRTGTPDNGEKVSSSVLFTDAYVISSAIRDEQKLRYAIDYVRTATATDTVVDLVSGVDREVPRMRWVLSASREVMQHPRVTADPLLVEFDRIVQSAVAAPTHGLTAVRDKLACGIRTRLIEQQQRIKKGLSPRK